MGIVHANRLVNIETRPPCDARCTNALGPKCDCICFGKNHGSRRIVEVVRDEGGIPTAKAGNPAIAAEWRAALDAARQRIAQLPGYSDWAAGVWIDGSKYARIANARAELMAVMRLTSHSKRMARIAAIAQD
jgi:hypothetical protein